MHGGGGGRGMMRVAPLTEADRRPISRATVRRVLGFFRPYRRRVAITILAIIVVAMPVTGVSGSPALMVSTVSARQGPPTLALI